MFGGADRTGEHYGDLWSFDLGMFYFWGCIAIIIIIFKVKSGANRIFVMKFACES